MSELSDAMNTAAALRFPVFEKGTAASTKVEQIEEHVTVTAYWQGDLEQERLEAHRALQDLQSEWDHLVGWEALKRTKTETAVEDAKRQLRPDLYDRLADLRWRIKRWSEQIDRLERDFTKASRVYTFITGG